MTVPPSPRANSPSETRERLWTKALDSAIDIFARDIRKHLGACQRETAATKIDPGRQNSRLRTKTKPEKEHSRLKDKKKVANIR